MFRSLTSGRFAVVNLQGHERRLGAVLSALQDACNAGTEVRKGAD